MKKFMITFAMAVVMVMSVMAIGPEKAFAKSVENGDIKVLESNFERVLNERSEELTGQKMTMVSQDIKFFDELNVYEWTVTAYDHELHDTRTETVRLAPEEVDETIRYLILL